MKRAGLAVFFFLIPMLLQPGLRDPAERSRPIALTAAAPRRGERAPQFARPYDFSSLNGQIQSHRLQLAACLMRNPTYAARRIRMTLQWEPQGLLRKVLLSPDAGSSVQSCVADLARAWPLKVHPGFESFSYSVVLAPSGF